MKNLGGRPKGSRNKPNPHVVALQERVQLLEQAVLKLMIADKQTEV